ncbi:hypothetical protein FACS189411_08370 [Bacteroidia bacterium]|nr:hypothetical protein FACS189411_08370 [Bacteroidia bacterium]
METIIVTSETTIEKILERVIDKKIPQPMETTIEKTYSINQVAKMLRRSHKRVSDMVVAGLLKATADNRIYESSIKEYNKK